MKLSIRIEAPENSSSGADESDSTGSPNIPQTKILNKISEVLEGELEEIYPSSKSFESAEISLAFVNSGEIRELNKNYRNIDEPTDVLSFPLIDFDGESENFGLPVLLLGDIVICPEQVKILHPELEIDEAVCLMIAHSFLHLLGHDHDTEEKEIEMWKKQNEIKNKILKSLEEN